MNVSHKPPGSEYVGKAFLGLIVTDTGQIVFDFQNFHQGQKSPTLFYGFRNLDQGLVHGVEICPRLNLETKVLVFVFISLTCLRRAKWLGHRNRLPNSAENLGIIPRRRLRGKKLNWGERGSP